MTYTQAALPDSLPSITTVLGFGDTPHDQSGRRRRTARKGLLGTWAANEVLALGMGWPKRVSLHVPANGNHPKASCQSLLPFAAHQSFFTTVSVSRPVVDCFCFVSSPASIRFAVAAVQRIHRFAFILTAKLFALSHFTHSG
jgi:hypothetical protein